MSNRIDLTQFEDITKGKWVYHEGKDRFLGKTVELHIPHPALDNEIHRIDGEPVNGIIRIRQLGGGEWPKKEDIKAMSLTPELIAELKRCYEEIDALRNGLDMAHRCLSAHNFRQCDTCGDHYHDDYGPLCGHITSE